MYLDRRNQNSGFSPKDRRRRSHVCRLVGVLAGGIALGWLGATGCAPPRTDLNYMLITEAWNTIQQHYVDRSAIKATPVTYGAISGMVDALDDTGHSTFLSPDMVTDLKNRERGEFKGIGVEIGVNQGHVVVVAPIDGSPAQRAGMRTGDLILKVNGKDITGLPLSQVVQRITGPAGTSVRLTILEPRTGHTRELTITRASIHLHDVTWNQLPGTTIAHLRISSFDGGVARDFRNALEEIERRQLTGIILDLRDNPGGILDAAVSIASQFLSHGNVLLVKNARGKIKPMPVEKGGMATHIPLVVLINKGTASASEIVAGALRDSKRATLVGETTFGTGTVLGEFKLSDGSALLLAIEEWLTPDGQSFWHKGIQPQIAVSLPDEAQPLLPEGERDLTPEELRSSDDRQLLRALQLVTAQADHSDGNASTDETRSLRSIASPRQMK